MSFDRTVSYWRARMGLSSFSMRTGELPAGYIQWEHSNPDGYPEEINAVVTDSRVLSGKSIRVQDYLRDLASQVVGGTFERSDGSWYVLSKTLWEDQPVVGVFTTDDYRITERSLRSELRERLVTSEVQAQVHRGNVIDGNTVTDETIVSLVTSTSDARKAALNIDKALDLTRLFTIIQEIPGWSREQVALVAEPTPLLVVADVLDIHNEAIDALRLNRIELGNNIEIHLPRNGHTVAFTGTLVGKRVHMAQRVPYHRLTVWVHSERRIDAEVRVWDQGFWNQGVWA